MLIRLICSVVGLVNVGRCMKVGMLVKCGILVVLRGCGWLFDMGCFCVVGRKCWVLFGVVGLFWLGL